MSAAHWLAYAAACLAVAVVPGPSLSLIIANTLRHGRAAGIASVAGTQAGFALLVIVLAAGFQALLAAAAPFFGWLRIIGALYLAWLGLRIILGGKGADDGAHAAPGAGRAFTQGFLVLLSNPKVLLFLAAFLPQFVPPQATSPAAHILLLGGVFMAIAAFTDSLYVLAASRAGRFAAGGGGAGLRRLSGGLLIGGGLWLALAGRGQGQ